MIARLKPMVDIYNDPTVETVKKNNHYWKFYYKDKPALGWRDFYSKYWRGDRIVTIKPKRDRKKKIIRDKFEVYGKRGNYVFTAYRCWFEWIRVFGSDSTGPFFDEVVKAEKDWVRAEKSKKTVREVMKDVTSLQWDDLFEI